MDWTNHQQSAMEAYLTFARWCFESDGVDFEQRLASFCEEESPFSPIFELLNSEIDLESWRTFAKEHKNPFLEAYIDATGQGTEAELSEFLTNDSRFNHEAWTAIPYFNAALKRYAYLVESFEKIPVDGAALFHRNRLLSALSPTNSVYFNPEVMEKALKTNGASLKKGFSALRSDIDPETALLQIRTCDKEHYLVGDNLASCRGGVVFENDIMELIHYPSPSGPNYDTPILITPPWINKFYILDLEEKNSLVRYLTAQGFEVFMISWRNPRLGRDNFTMDDYAHNGLVEATNTVIALTKTDSVHVAGYCIGGTLAAITYSSFGDEYTRKVKSLTLLTTLLDFNEAGDVCYLMDVDTNPIATKWLDEKHGLPSTLIESSFQYLQPDQLVWPNVIKYYYLGEKAPPSALMYWNSDGTQLTQNLVNWMKTNAYGGNTLVTGTVHLMGQLINLNKLNDVNCYFVAAEKDHIAPWKGVFNGALSFAPKARFILGSSGHIGGIIHNPEKNRRSYRVVNVTQDREKATYVKEIQGSWWFDWSNWLADQSSVEKGADRPIKHPYLRTAPGRYVSE